MIGITVPGSCQFQVSFIVQHVLVDLDGINGVFHLQKMVRRSHRIARALIGSIVWLRRVHSDVLSRLHQQRPRVFASAVGDVRLDQPRSRRVFKLVHAAFTIHGLFKQAQSQLASFLELVQFLRDQPAGVVWN